MRTILLTVALLIAFRSVAACDDLLSKVNEKLGYPKPDAEASFDLAHCKPWPGNPGKIILAIARHKKGSHFGPSDDQTGEGLYDLDVLIVDKKSGKILQRVIQRDELASDAERLSGLSIDTAPYHLAPGVRGFGVFTGNSHLGGTSSERTTFRLFTVADGKLVQVLAPIITQFSVHSSFTDCGEYRETSRIISMGKRSSHGYADLRIHEKHVEPEMTLVGTECKEVSKVSQRRYTIRFDGKEYALPPELKQF